MLDRAERAERRDLGREPRLAAALRAEALARRQIDDQHHGHLALFDEDLHVGLVHARADVPVDACARRRPGWYWRTSRKREPLTLEDRGVVAGQLLGGEPVGRDLDLAQRLEQLLGDHGMFLKVLGISPENSRTRGVIARRRARLQSRSHRYSRRGWTGATLSGGVAGPRGKSAVRPRIPANRKPLWLVRVGFADGVSPRNDAAYADAAAGGRRAGEAGPEPECRR